MTEDDEFVPVETEPGTIGVGMGGSCPVCRAPVDLGQEFCLECGSPIRFTPRQRRPQRGRGAEGATAGRRTAPAKSGFPWIPFLIVLALIGGGVAFALVDGDGDKASSRATTEEGLPSITNSAPTETATESDTSTTTVESCDSTSPIDDSVPAVGDTTAPTGLPGEQIPELGSDGAATTDTTGVPSIGAGSSSGGTVTVDTNGTLCSGTDPTDTTTTPTVPPTSTTTTPTTPTTPASGDWPAGEEGYTVIVAGYANDEARARQVATDLQADGFDDGGVLFSSQFSSLCPGFWVVFSGNFETRSKADDRLAELSAKDYAGMYVREIKTGGSTPSNCTQSRPQN